MSSTTTRLNDDLRMIRARFYLQQFNECRQELSTLSSSSDVSQIDRDFWQRRIILETQLTSVAQNDFPKSENPDTSIAFQEHIMNLYGLFVLSPQNDLKLQILQQLESYMYQPELYNNIFLHLYGGLILWKSGKISLARDLLTRTSTINSQIEPAEMLLEKLFFLFQICISKNLLNESQEIINEMNKIDSDDILIQLSKMDLLVQISTPKPDSDEETSLLSLTNDIISQYGPSLRPLIIQSSELLRQNNYRQAYTILKQARQFCTEQQLPFPAEVQINSIICLHHRSFSNLVSVPPTGSAAGQQQQQQQQQIQPYQQQQSQIDTTIASLEAELKQAYPNHPFFTQRDELILKVQQYVQESNIPTV